MHSDNKDIFHSIMAEADKINATLNHLHSKFISNDSTVSSQLEDSLKALEHALEIIVRNTDLKTNEVNPTVFNNSTYEESIKILKRIGLLSRRIEREIKEHCRRIDNK